MASVGAARGIGLAAWLVGMPLTPSLASALEAEPNCMGLGIGLLNPYFDIPWSADYAGHFSSFVERPSAAAYWGMETLEPTGSAETRLSLGKGLAVDAAGTPVTIFQAVSPPPIDPDFAFVVIDVSARVFVSSGAIAISLSNGPAPYAASAYPRTPFRTGETGK